MYRRQLLRATTVLGVEGTAVREAGTALHPRGGDRQDTRRQLRVWQTVAQALKEMSRVL